MTVCRGGPQHSSFDVWVVMSFKYWVQLFRSRRKYSLIYMCIRNDCQIYWYFRVFLSRVNEQSYCTSVIWRIFPEMLQTRGIWEETHYVSQQKRNVPERNSWHAWEVTLEGLCSPGCLKSPESQQSLNVSSAFYCSSIYEIYH